MINNECIKGDEDEKALLRFQDPTLLICGFYNPLSGFNPLPGWILMQKFKFQTKLAYQ